MADSPRRDPTVFRICSKCSRALALERFNWKRREQNERQSRCVDCQRNYHREWYGRNRERVIARVRRNDKRWTAHLARLKWEYLAANPCVDCGESDPVVLEFDHVGVKEREVSTLFRLGASWSRIQSEIAQCEVRCANCHRRRTLRQMEAQRVPL